MISICVVQCSLVQSISQLVDRSLARGALGSTVRTRSGQPQINSHWRPRARALDARGALMCPLGSARSRLQLVQGRRLQGNQLGPRRARSSFQPNQSGRMDGRWMDAHCSSLESAPGVTLTWPDTFGLNGRGKSQTAPDG